MICICTDCEKLAPDASDDGDELCENCIQNRAERAWERYCEDFHGGSGPLPLRDQQIAAMKFK